MAGAKARTGKATGPVAGQLAVCLAGRPAALLGRLAFSAAAVAFSVPAYAQVSNSDVSGVSGTAITGSTTLSGTLNGNNGAGYFVTSTGTLTINNGLLENYTTSGGSGSGGGLGAGGAIFIDTGGTVILNGTSFSHDTAIGGLGGTSSPYGGDLNNIAPVGTTPGTNGVNGTTFPDNEYTFGDGRGNGVPGIGVTGGGNATDGVGGIGGVGGPGTNGWTYNPIAEANNDIAIANIAATSGIAAGETAIIVTFVAGAVAELASSANPFEDPLAPITGISSGLLAAVNAINLAADGTAVGAAVENQQITQGVLNTWNTLYQAGLAGNGGNGENGGNGGNGSYGFGGGAGGQGGAYGLTENPAGTDGTGGAGGAGGAGGFGGGGGAGGYGFGANQNGCGGSTLVAGGCTSTSGAGGVGGAAGFGGGVGSTGGATGVSNATGGGGGDAYGGAIFVNSGASLTITGTSTFSGDNAIGGASLNNGPAGGAAGTDLFMMQGSTVDIAPGASAGNIPNVVTFNGTIADNSTTSIGAPTVPQTAGYPVSGGAYLTIFSGITVFNGANTYSGQTVINGGALGGPLNTGANTAGAPNYALTDGALQATDGVGLPTASNLNFSGPNQFTGGVLQIAGTVLSNGVVQPTVFTRTVSPNPNPDGGSNPGGVQWTGSGGFAALNAPLTVTLSGGAPLAWSNPATPNGFVPFGSSLMFGSADSNNTVTFTNAIDITGGSYSAGTAASILVANNGNALGSTAIMSGVISGAGDLSIGGGGFNGTLVLSAANTYTGGTYVNSGTLAFSGNGSIADSSGLFIANTGSLDISQSKGVTIPTLTGSGTVFLGGQELTVADGGTFSGTLADGGIAGGTKGSLIISAGTETLSGTNTYTGDTTINSGATLALTGTGSIADSSPVLDNGIFDISQTAQGAAITSLSGSGQALIGSNLLVITNGSTTFSGDINDGGLGGGTGGSLVVAGGTQTLSGVNTYTGVTIVESGATLALSGTGSIATSSLVDAVGTFDISQTTAGASITTLAGTGIVTLGKQALTITNGSTTFGGVIADGGIGGGTKGSLIIGGGTETLTGTNVYTGNTTIDGSAVLALAGTGSISQSADVIDNGTFDISQTSLGTTITTLSGSGKVALGSELLLITNGSTTFSGVLADGGIGGGSGGMLGVSGGTQTLTGINTYTGGSLIGSGATLALSGTGSIADSAGVFDDGTFDISQTSAGASIVTLFGNGLVSLGAQALTITSGSTTFAGVIADGGIGHGTGGNLIVSGGTETLSGTNTYTGTTTTNLGATLALSGTGSIATSSDVIDNGTFDISQTTSGASIKTLSGGGSTALGAQTLTITDGSTTFSGVIADGGIVGGTGGNLTVSGGTQTLSGINTYTGLTTIAPNPSTGTATLALSGTGSIATSSEVSIATNGTFDISQTTAGASITTLSGDGNVALGGQTLTITAGAAGAGGTNPAGIFSGIIADGGLGGGTAGSVAITGGHEELTGVNTYTGGTSITGGATLSVNNSNSLGANTSQLTINNGTLLVDASITIPQPIAFGATGPNVINLDSNNVTLSGALSGPGGFYALNGGTLSLTGTTSNIGSIVLGQGTQLTASSTASAGLATTPIVVVSPGGSAIDVFTGSVHVVGALDILNSATPELIILPGDQLVGIGSVNIATVIQGGGGSTPGDGAGTLVATASLTNLPSSTYTIQIDGAVNSAANCPFVAHPTGCAGQYSSTIVVGAGNTFTAAGTLAPQLTGIGAPANNNYIPPVTSSFIVVQAQGGVLGSFSSLTQPALGTSSSGGLAAGTRIDALYYNTGSTTPIGSNSASSPNGTAAQYAADPNAIALWVTPASYTNLSSFGVSLSQNEMNLGAALDALRGPAGVSNNAQATWDFGYLFAQQPKNLPGVFDSLTGEVNADAAEGAFQQTNQFLGLMLDPFNRPFSPGSAVESSSSHSALGFDTEDPQPGAPLNVASQDVSTPPLATKAATFDQRWMAWGAGLGAYSNISGDPATAGTHNFSTSTYGFAGGMDYSVPGALFGFAVAGGGDNWMVTQENLGTGNSYDVQAGLYGRTNFGHAYIGAALSVANNWMKTTRTPFAGAPLSASFDAQTFGGRLEAGYSFIYNAMKITPFAAGQVLAFHSPDYGETDLSGGGFALNYAARTETDLSSQLGGRFETATSVSNMPLIVRVQAAWEHDWVNDAGLAATFQAGLAPGALPGAGTSFIVNGAALPQNLAVVSAGTDLYITRAISINAKFDGQIASGAQTYGGSLTFRDAW